MIRASDLIALWRRALDEGWGYIWGTAGETWTQAKQDKATREQTIKWGSKWIGKRVADCSGLAVWAFRQLGGSVYHGSNTIWNQYVTGRCELKDGWRTDDGGILPGDPVFLRKKDGTGWNRHHIGYYVGYGKVIEAKGTSSGVVMSDLSRWHETAHWLNVEYENEVIFVGKPTLRKGDSGENVSKMQSLLNGFGYGLTVDGKFGAKTETALKDFQWRMGLDADGICGDKTWSKLENEPPEDEVVPVSRREIIEIIAKLQKLID